MFYTWLIVVILLAIIEMLSVGLVCIWFVISALAAMILSLFTDNIYLQFGVFVIGGIILLLLTRKITKKLVPKKEKTNIDRIVGMTGLVVDKITKKNPGSVKVDGKVWTAVAKETIPVDTEVKILEINSTKLTVERMEE